MQLTGYFRKENSKFEIIYLVFFFYLNTNKKILNKYNNLKILLFYLFKNYINSNYKHLYISSKGFHLNISSNSYFFCWLFPVCINIKFMILSEKIFFYFFNIIISVIEIMYRKNIKHYTTKIKKYKSLSCYYFFFICELPIFPLIIYMKKYGCRIGWKNAKKNSLEFDENITHYVVHHQTKEQILDRNYISVSKLLEWVSSI